MKQSHKIGMTEEDVKEALFSIFEEWMGRQTVGVHPKTGETLYYRHDVENFMYNAKKLLFKDQG